MAPELTNIWQLSPRGPVGNTPIKVASVFSQPRADSPESPFPPAISTFKVFCLLFLTNPSGFSLSSILLLTILNQPTVSTLK